MKWNGKKLQELRESNNMQIEDLLYEFNKYCDNISYQDIYDWENNIKVPNLLNSYILADIFKVNIEYFLSK